MLMIRPVSYTHLALAYVRTQERILEGVRSKLQVPVDELTETVEKLQESNRKLEKEMASVKKQNVLAALDSLVARCV